MIGAFVSLFLLAEPSTPPGVPEQALEHAAFCHDGKLSSADRAWCPHAEAMEASCPGFRQACRRPAHPEDKSETKTDAMSLPSALGGFTTALLWVFLGLVVAFVIWQVLKNTMGTRRPLADDVDAAPDDESHEAEQTALDIEESEPDALLALAQQAAGRGELRRAFVLVHRACLAVLEQRGKIHRHPSRTNGEYLRDLAGEPALRDETRTIFREVERVQFGAHQPTPSTLAVLLERVKSLRVLVLVFALFGGGCQDEETRPVTGDCAACIGLLLPHLEQTGVQVRVREAPLAELEPHATQGLLLLDSSELAEEDWDAVLGWVRSGGVLFVVHQRFLPDDLASPTRATVSEGTPLTMTWSEAPPGVVPGTAALTTSEPGHFPIIVRGEASYAVASMVGSGTVITFADDRLFENAALAIPGNVALLELLPSWVDELEVVGLPERSPSGFAFFGGATPPSADDKAESTPLSLIMVQLLAVVAAFLVSRGAALGRLRDPVVRDRHVFSEHAKTLGHHYARARAEGHATQILAKWVHERLRTRMLTTRERRGPSALAQAVSRRTGRDEIELLRDMLEAESGGEAGSRPEVHEHLIQMLALRERLEERP